jgi:hypothetical protein
VYAEFLRKNLKGAIWKTKPEMGDNIEVGFKEIGFINVEWATYT